MDIYTTEEEQIEQIKKWLKTYGPTIIISMILALGLSFGWRYYRGNEAKLSAQASVNYEQMLMNFMNNKNDTAKLQAQNLIENYSRTPYAKLAGLMLAKQAVHDNDLAAAEKHLRWVMAKARSPAVKQVATIRTARVLLAEKKPSEALDLLQKVSDKSYLAAIESVKGDIYVRLNNKAAARQAYQQALKNLAKNDTNRPIIEMKLNGIAEVKGE